MTEERPTGDPPSPAGEDIEESVAPARPIRPVEGEDRGVSLPGGEYVGRAQPMDPARRRAARPPGAGAEPPPHPPAPEPDEDQGSREPPPGDRPAPPRARQSSSRRVRAASARGAVDRVRRADFPVVLRGYDRTAVDAYVAEVAQLVAELEATQLPESVVQRALDDVGDETSAILKRAHEAGEEITSRSRSQAEGRLEAAEREADLIRSEAENQVRGLEEDVQTVWRERQRLIEDIRTLADDVLALADDAIERIPEPERLPSRDAEDDAGDGSWASPEDSAGGPDEADRAEPRDDPSASRLAMAAGAPLELAAEPGDEPTVEDEGPDEVTVEQPPEDEDTAERPPGTSS